MKLKKKYFNFSAVATNFFKYPFVTMYSRLFKDMVSSMTRPQHCLTVKIALKFMILKLKLPESQVDGLINKLIKTSK